MGLLFLALGLSIIHMGMQGRTPAQALSPRDIPAFLAFGALFAWIGIVSIVRTLGGDKVPRWTQAVLLSMSMLFLAAPFLIAGILTPDQIRSSVFVNGMRVSESTGGRSGAIAFVGMGALILLSIPFLVRRLLRPSRGTTRL